MFLDLCLYLFFNYFYYFTTTLGYVAKFVWDHILQEPSSSITNIHTELPLLTKVRLSTRWSRFTTQAYRLAYQDAHISPHKFQKALIHHFWYSKPYPNARTMFYRTIHHRIPTQVFIHKYNPQIPTCYSLCGAADDTLRHFIIDCPKKWAIRTKVLHQFFPHHTFSAELVYGVLCYLHVPYSAPSSAQPIGNSGISTGITEILIHILFLQPLSNKFTLKQSV
ncbi:hypothetical protein G6F43_012834 [Rhizopus delemar]|nr:hypothetical protein G6F43_012834 [Rhizopus delemar]